MSSSAEKVFEGVKTLPDQQASEVLDFVEFLKSKTKQAPASRIEIALATLVKHIGLYDCSFFIREELHERP